MAINRPTLVTGGCGFVGRHLLKALKGRVGEVWIIDDLSTGRHPSDWIGATLGTDQSGIEWFQYGECKVAFLNRDLASLLIHELEGKAPLLPHFGDVFHLASIVGGRMLIDGDPLLVARDLAIDALLFQWLTRHPDRAKRVMYASSSAAYPVQLQQAEGHVALHEDSIQFKGGSLGQPDMTYGWSKLTGEYLATLAAKHYGLHVACVRPFSGYGEDQDPSYPTPAIARRIAKHDNPVVVWGSGKQARDFVYIDDCIEAFFVILDHVSDGSGINIGTGQLTSFHDLIQLMAEVEGYAPTIQPLEDKPVGVSSRYADTTRIFEMGWKPATSLRDGMAKVIAYAKTQDVSG